MNRKLIQLIFVLILLVGVGSASYAMEIYNLNSEQINYIYTVEDFDKIMNDSAGFFVLMNDLDLSTSKSIGQIAFAGILHGNGHVLSNWSAPNGLFSVINNAEIYDLGLESGSATNYVLGSQITNSKLENVYVDHIVTTSSSLTGILLNSTLTNMYVTLPGGFATLKSGNTETSVYYDADKFTGTTTVGAGLTTAAMMNQVNYTGWDFNHIWTVEESVTNPNFGQYNSLRLMGSSVHYNKAEGKVAIKLVFNQTPSIGTGSIHLLRKVDDSEVVTFASSSSVLEGKVATLSSEILLEENVEYYITVDASAFDNGSGGTMIILGRVSKAFEILHFELGDGTSEHPYEIRNFEALNKIREGLEYHYKLMDNMDLEGKSMAPIGNAATPFIGGFDGSDHVISNYTYEALDGSYAGLFGYSKGSIKNLGVNNLEIKIQGSASSSVSLSGSYVGGLVGYNTGRIENCYTTGVVLGKSNVGGLVGNNQGVITLCYSEANVTSSDYLSSGYNNEGFYTGGLSGRNALGGTISLSYATGDVAGCEQVGGLVGNAFKGGLISDSYASGDVIGYYDVGGFMGRNYSGSTAENVYSTGAVSLYTGGTHVGGLIGTQASAGTLTNGYYNQETSGQNDDLGNGSPRMTSEMFLESTYVGFDFNTIWTIIENRSMPYLNLNEAAALPGLINQAPTLTTTAIYTLEDTVVSGNLLGVDPDGDAINYTLVQVTSSGSINVTTSGAYTYMPNPNFNGEDQFLVILTDGFVTTTSAAITVHVESVNDAPSVSNGTISLDEDSSFVGQLVSTDADENDVLEYTLITEPVHGTVTLNHLTGYFVYSSVANYYGSDQFTWQASDGVTSQQATISVAIASVNDSPVTTHKTFDMRYNEVLSTDLALLSTDVEGDALTFSLNSSPIFGTAHILMGSSLLSYTPVHIGIETLVYSVSDLNTTTVGSITIHIVNAEQSAPTGLTAERASQNKSDGAIIGTDSTMAYKKVDATEWTEVTSDKITGLTAGTYAVRFKAKLGYNAGENAYVTVEIDEDSTGAGGTEDAGGSGDRDEGSSYNSPETSGEILSGSIQPVSASIVIKTTDTTEVIDGKTVTQVGVETNEIRAYLKSETPNGENQNLVSFKTAQTSDSVQFNLTGEAVDLFSKNQIDYAFETPLVAYQFTSNAIDIKRIAMALGLSESQYANIKIGVNMKRTSQEIRPDGVDGKVLMSPIQFEITASYTSESGEIKTISVHAFNHYVERTFTLSDEIDQALVTTGVVINSDGRYAHIPTIVIKENGKWKVKMNSMTNSEYTLIYNDVKVSSVSGHWSETVVNRMASDLVLVDYETFKPNEAVTRGEFIDYVVRGLGLYRDTVDFETKLNDIENSRYAQSIQIANAWGLVSGYENNTFRPNHQISREEAMMIFANALTLIQFEHTGTVNHDISQYIDKTEISNWAVDAVNRSLKVGVFSGRSNQQLAPKENLTCAEAVVAVHNLLIKTELIAGKTN
ncbi:S-layer homology domain-containing protein [Fusibacter sp. 3D3]|uniref:S-layer homology domain-containing protein n=1 Tax=Fusibacter sp. 3D3 TaxID=1048380 RepID=UPI000852A27B|nr:S-layer homology domain-containing protein [Fusibacter sp. 3D3]GAU76296.1 large exoproteins involved in heme utilization or adhesion [Fusibacter sp. 3D3]